MTPLPRALTPLRLLCAVLALSGLASCRASGPVSELPATTILPQRAGAGAGPTTDLGEPPVVAAVGGIAKVDLIVAKDFLTGYPTFVYGGLYNVAPTIKIKPGDTIVVNLKNALPNAVQPGTMQPDAMGPQYVGMPLDVNLHFHGLTVSPRKPGDDVLTMLAMPGEKLHYVVHVPPNQEPGLYWYHTHVHGETNYQVGEGGMSGAIVVEGLERHLPRLAGMKERVLMLRDTSAGSAGPADVPQVRDPNPCSPNPGIVTLNTALRPVIRIAPGEQQFFRLVNASGHKTLKLAVDGEKLQLVAVDGYALDSYPGTPPTRMDSSIVVPPAGRAEFVVTGPASGHGTFRTLCYDSGFNGDSNPNVVLAHLEAPAGGGAHRGNPAGPLTVGAPVPENAYTTPLPPIAAKRVVVFSEGPHHFFINGKTYRPGAPPMFVVHVGTVEEWHILNVTGEVHDFHIHQVHFFVKSINGVPVVHPYWSDSFVIPHRAAENVHSKPGSIVAIMDFRDPIIKGTFLFHCHILDHEDHGMMAKIQAI